MASKIFPQDLQCELEKEESSSRSHQRPSSQNNPYNSPYQNILRTLALFGITCKPVRKNFFLLSYWDTICLLMTILAVTFSMLIIDSIIISRQALYTFYVYLSLGLAIRVTLLRKRQDIYKVLSRIMDLQEYMQIDVVKCRRCSRVSMFAFFAWFLSITIILIIYFQRITADNQIYDVYGYKLTEAGMGYWIYAVPISLAYSTVCSSMTISISVIVCSNLYFSARNILRAYGNKLTPSSKVFISQNILISSISRYRSVMICCTDIDSGVSLCSLFLYAAAITSFFNTLSTCYTSFGAAFNDLISLGQIGISFFLSLVVFTALTVSGTQANSEHDVLKMVVLELVENTTQSHPDVDTMTILNTLTEIIMMKVPNFTGGGMFTINNSLVLTTAGAMITYGVLLF